MGLWSGLKTLGKEIASGAKDISVGYGRLRDAAKKTLGGVDRNLEGKTLMRFGNEAEARWVTPFRPTSRKVFGDISYESTERLSNAASGAWDSVAAAAEETAALSSKNTSEFLGAVSQDFNAINGIEEAIAKEAPKVAPTYNTYRRLSPTSAKNRQSEGLSWLNTANKQEASTYGVNAKEISESAIRDTGYGLSAEDRVLKRNRPNYVNELREQGVRERATARTTLGEEAGTAATGTTQPDIVAAANENMGAKAQAISEAKSAEAAITQEGIQTTPSTVGQEYYREADKRANAELQRVTAETTNNDIRNTAMAVGGGTVVANAMMSSKGVQTNAQRFGGGGTYNAAVAASLMNHPYFTS